MKTICRAVAFGAVLTALGLLAACGGELTAPKSSDEAAPAGIPGSPTTTAAPQEEGEAEPATLADAEALLEKARLNLDRLALNEPAPAPAAAGAAAPSAPRAQSMPVPAPRDEAAHADKSSSADGSAPPPPPAKEANTCETTCKAFSSLTRASDAVCRLDTDGKRCERARQIREDASHRVASCGCAK
jgi:hypothetical protein